MGFSSSKKKFILHEEIDRYSKYNPTLEKFFDKYRDYDGYIRVREFDMILQRKINQKIVKKLFKIFSSEKEKLNYEDLKHFYATMRSNSINGKIAFLTQLIFSNKPGIILQKYFERVNLFFENCKEMKMLFSSKFFLDRITEKRKIIRESFLKTLESSYKNEIKDFSFLKLLTYTTLIDNGEIKIITEFKDINHLICGCFQHKPAIETSDYGNIFDRMELEFHRVEKMNEGVFTVQTLEKWLKELEMSTPLINCIISYLKRKTAKVYIYLPRILLISILLRN
jgi:hypothetical protein